MAHTRSADGRRAPNAPRAASTCPRARRRAVEPGDGTRGRAEREGDGLEQRRRRGRGACARSGRGCAPAIALSRVRRGGALADVHRRRVGLVARVPAGVPQPPEQVGLLGVQEEALVEAADRLERLAAQQHAAAGHPVRPPAARRRLPDRGRVVGPGCARRQPVQEQRLRVRRAQAREAPLRESTSRRLVDRARPDAAEPRVGAQRVGRASPRLSASSGASGLSSSTNSAVARRCAEVAAVREAAVARRAG